MMRCSAAHASVALFLVEVAAGALVVLVRGMTEGGDVEDVEAGVGVSRVNGMQNIVHPRGNLAVMALANDTGDGG